MDEITFTECGLEEEILSQIISVFIANCHYTHSWISRGLRLAYSKRLCQPLLILEDERFVKISTVRDSWGVSIDVYEQNNETWKHSAFSVQVHHTQNLIRNQSKQGSTQQKLC